MTELQEFALSHKTYWWWVKDPANLSERSVVEGTLQYGDFEDKKTLLRILGETEFKKQFEAIAKEPRTSLEIATICYWQDYLSNRKTHA